MRAFTIAAVIAAATTVATERLAANESFDEILTLRPLPDGKVLAHFAFNVSIDHPRDTPLRHYRLFPRQIGEVIQRYHIRELNVAFTQGTWRIEDWGYPPVNDASHGAQVLARIGDEERGVAGNWKGLTNALSGMFCASLNYLDHTNSLSPRIVFAENKQEDVMTGTHLVYGQLPRENVCTENLTPWLKQLPCQSKSGLASLLNPYRLYDSELYSMDLTFRPECRDERCEVTRLHYKQTLSVVLSPRRLLESQEWTLQQLFDRKPAQACPLADNSRVNILLPADTDSRPKLDEHAYAILDIHPSTKMATIDAKKHDIGGLAIEGELVETKRGGRDTGRHGVAAHRFVVGSGGEKSGSESIIVNSAEESVDVVYFSSLPWYLSVYLHTLRIDAHLGNGSRQTLEYRDLKYQQSRIRGRPTVLEFRLTLPPQSTTTLRLDFDKGYLKYSEHPPDANRGFNIEPAMISFKPGGGKELPLACILDSSSLIGMAAKGATSQGDVSYNGCHLRIFTEPFLASLPTPDFSMPYNVITFTCTALALFFGRMFNLMARDMVVEEKEVAVEGQEKNSGDDDKAAVSTARHEGRSAKSRGKKRAE